MKTLKNIISAIPIAICSYLLSLLGFGCSQPADPDDILLMYGTPIGEFEIKGAVTNEEGKDLSDAVIRVTHPDVPSGIHSIATSLTDSKGNYEVKGHAVLPEMKVVCIPENDDLQPDSVIVKMDYKDGGKNNPWNQGHAEATVNFVLKSNN